MPNREVEARLVVVSEALAKAATELENLVSSMREVLEKDKNAAGTEKKKKDDKLPPNTAD